MDEARIEAEAISNPRAVQAIYSEFGVRSPKDQVIAIQLLGQIDTPLSSKVLALMAVYGKTPDVRRRATETLRRRDADDYLPVLVALLQDPLKYEVRPVGGPGSPGVLFIEGERANVRRVYAPPVPSVSFRPGDIIGYDASGMPTLIRPLGEVSSAMTGITHLGKSGTLYTFTDVSATASVSLRDIAIEAQRSAIAAQQQLAADVRAIEAENNAKTTFNNLVLTVARDASGQDLGNEPKDWRKVLEKAGRYPKKPEVKPTVDLLIAMAYQPVLGELTFTRSQHTSKDP